MPNSFSDYQSRIEGVLDRVLDNAEIPSRLQQAMRYSTLGGGKRIRALLVYAAGQTVNAPIDLLDNVAAALECVHCYSLIHDDLPAMDDDNLRRGKATNHKEFDEATAILAGDALLTLAFNLINNEDSGLSDTQARKISCVLSNFSGAAGMVGGQMLDIQATKAKLSQADLENIHRRKTAALIHAAVICGGLCGDYKKTNALTYLGSFADNIGLAFQVIDDILDIESSTEELGKTSGADENLGKATYPAILGLQKSKRLAQNLYQQAIESVNTISDNADSGDCELLANIAHLVIARNK